MECLGHKHRMAVHRPPAGHARHETGGKVGKHSGLGEQQKARVVGDPTRTLERLLRPSAGPTVPRSALEGAVLPRRQARPSTSEGRRMTKAAACQTAKARTRMPVHQHVPVRTLLRERSSGFTRPSPTSHSAYPSGASPWTAPDPLRMRSHIPPCLSATALSAIAQERHCLTPQSLPHAPDTQRGTARAAIPGLSHAGDWRQKQRASVQETSMVDGADRAQGRRVAAGSCAGGDGGLDQRGRAG